MIYIEMIRLFNARFKNLHRSYIPLRTKFLGHTVSYGPRFPPSINGLSMKHKGRNPKGEIRIHALHRENDVSKRTISVCS